MSGKLSSRSAGRLACVLALCVAATVAWGQDTPAKGAPDAEALGWRLGCQAYSFNRFTLYEAIDKNASLGLKVIELYPGQALSPEKPDVRFDHNAPAELVQEVLAKLKASNVQAVNYGVVGLPNDEVECRKVFDFAKAMGLETICSEPPEDAFPLLDKLTQEYGINVAIHNHPEPSRYWNPEKVLEVTKGLNARIGACADTGHWMRSGINPLEAIKMLEGRIISFHFKDLNQFGKGTETEPTHDVPWGTGKADMKAILAEVKRQGIKAVFSAEYEHNWENSLPEIAQCVANFNAMAAELAKAGQ